MVTQLLLGAPLGQIDEVERQRPRSDVTGAVGSRDTPVQLLDRKARFELQSDRGLDGIRINVRQFGSAAIGMCLCRNHVSSHVWVC
ncbi:MAG: hypothetical protein ACYSU7_01720 [Planctomycetota bacterium]